MGEAPSKKDGLTKSAHLGRGRNGSSRHFNFFWNAVSSPPRAVNKLRAGARGAITVYGKQSGDRTPVRRIYDYE